MVLAASPNLKQTGAYYTDERVARFLVDWAVRSAADRVLDPSFGGGVFLKVAAETLARYGGGPDQVFGAELDPSVRNETAARLRGLVNEAGLWAADFFSIEPQGFDAVVGNPPFVRYQAFSGTARDRALERAQRQGVVLPRLSSSWAPFVVHSCAMLRPGGRLAMVLPMEMWHAAYATPVLAHLFERFRELEVVTFEERLFPDLSQDTVLLLADGYGSTQAQLRWRRLRSSADLESHAAIPPRTLSAGDIARGTRRFIEEFVPEAALGLYRELAEDPRISRLGDIARVGIGYVSGNNRFFHLSQAEAKERQIPADYLVPAVCKGRALQGLRFTTNDWLRAEARGDAAYLLLVPPRAGLSDLPASIREYLAEGQRDGVHEAYKCRVRRPWYSVPHVYNPDAFLTYMSGKLPYLVVNAGGFVSPNNLHTVRLLDPSADLAARVAAGWRTALSRLSVEIEGHALGGGMLKLEPGEAGRVLVPVPNRGLDLHLLDDRCRRDTAATDEEIDRLVLGGLGVSVRDIRVLRKAASQMMERRYRGGRG